MRILLTGMLAFLAGCAAQPKAGNCTGEPQRHFTAWPPPPAWAHAEPDGAPPPAGTPEISFECHVLRFTAAAEQAQEVLGDSGLSGAAAVLLDAPTAEHLLQAAQGPAGSLSAAPRIIAYQGQVATLEVSGGDRGLRMCIQGTEATAQAVTVRYAVAGYDSPVAVWPDHMWSLEAENSLKPGQTCAQRTASSDGQDVIVVLVTAKRVERRSM